MFPSPVDATAPPAAGLVGPLGSSSFSLPAVGRALAEMEGGGSSGTTLGVGRRAGAPTSPMVGSAPSPTGQTQHEVLQNFFKNLLNAKVRSGVSPGTSRVSPGVGTSKVPPTGPRTSDGGAGGGGGSAQADGGSGTEDG